MDEKNKFYLKYLLLTAGMLVCGFSFSLGQAVSLSDTVLDFASVTTGEKHSLDLTITNNQNRDITIRNGGFEEKEFSTDLDSLQIPAFGLKTFHVFFFSRQNINYTDFLHINIQPAIRPLIARISAEAVYPESYYQSTQNKRGTALKAALHNIIKNHTTYGYKELWNILQDTDEDPDNPNNVILLYTGWSYPKSNHGGDPNEWNREHVWAKSHGNFGTSPPAGTDVHHIRPADVSVNNARGNLDFDNGGSYYTDADGFTGCRYDIDSWEPRDAVKGDVARMLYYMVVRYEGDSGDGGLNLELTETIPSSPNKEPLLGKKSTLYLWNLQDTVDNWERRRNDRIYNWQKNRNPFIDHPELAERLPSISGIAVPAAVPDMVSAPQDIDFGIAVPGDSLNFYLAIINTGQAELDVNQISNNDPAFVTAQKSLALAAESFTYIKITFQAQQTEKVYRDTLRIQSNDPNRGTLLIPLRAEVSSSVGLLSRDGLSEKFELLPNYPNPFNPNTVIRYHLAVNSKVSLTVYNVLGQKMEELLNGRQTKGIHQVTFNGNNFPDGIYFYRLQANCYVQTRKMILLR